MGRKRLRRYSEVERYRNVITVNVTGESSWQIDKVWNDGYFATEREVTLELGCGRGEYTLNLARKYPERNFIGIDMKADRLCLGARAASSENLDNVLFIKIRIEHLPFFFPENFIQEAWIPFPDPHLCNENGKRRLTSPRFLAIYRQLVKPGGNIHLKTDDDTLYRFSLESIKESPAKILHATDDLYSAGLEHPELTAIRTTYEKRFLAESKTIKYIGFSFQEPVTETCTGLHTA